MQVRPGRGHRQGRPRPARGPRRVRPASCGFPSVKVSAPTRDRLLSSHDGRAERFDLSTPRTGGPWVGSGVTFGGSRGAHEWAPHPPDPQDVALILPVRPETPSEVDTRRGSQHPGRYPRESCLRKPLGDGGKSKLPSAQVKKPRSQGSDLPTTTQ